MDKKAVLEIISQFKKALESKGIKIDKLILFGSYASGKYREGSDIDLVVISEDFSGKDFWERIEIISDAIYEVFMPIEAVAMTPEEWSSKESLIMQKTAKLFMNKWIFLPLIRLPQNSSSSLVFSKPCFLKNSCKSENS
jgi:predicted nucleotidyltransferase